MEVIRFINGRPVGAMPAMTVANEGMLRVIREIQMRAIQEQKVPIPNAKQTDSDAAV